MPVCGYYAKGGKMELIATFVVLVLIVAAYWSLVIMPKQQEFKKHQKFVRQMKLGDQVVTYGGLVGTITELDPDSGLARVRLAENVEVQLITAALTQPFNPGELARNAQIGLEDAISSDTNEGH
jgi:preprotein translocase subunit YajC